jgi:Sortase domain
MEHPVPRPGPRRALPCLAGTRRLLKRRPNAAALLLAGVVAVSGGVAGLTWLAARPALAPAVPRAAAPSPGLPGLPAVLPGLAAARPAPAHGRRVAPPASLLIPAIGVHTRLTRLGLTPQGTLQVPASTSMAGWYTGSPRPGQVGSSIIAGHIDSVLGPAVFFRLRLLRPGDLVYVRRTNGSLAVFRVYAEHMYAKDSFPTLRVYGPTPDPELHLITCGGVFDRAAGSYLSNVVVYASQVRFHSRMDRRHPHRPHRGTGHPRHHRPLPGRA